MPVETAGEKRFSLQDVPWILAFLILFLLVFREFFFTNGVFFERDTTIVEIPARKLTVQLLREGHFALWTDAYGGGQPFLANPKNAILYPATLLYLLFPLFTAFKLYYLLHVLAGWLGFFYFGRAISLARRSAFLGACLFVFGGMYLSSFEFYNHIAALAWMPWILVTLRAGPRKMIPRTAWLAVFWTLMILAGAPEFILITAGLSITQAFFQPKRWKKELAVAGLSLALAGLISAAQIMPSLELLHQTGRENEPATWPLELLQLPNMLFPGVLGNDREPGHNDFWGWHLFDNKFPLYYSMYFGFGMILLAFLSLKRPRDRTRMCLLIAGAVFFLVSCGRYSPFFPLQRLVPILSSIRYPVKFFLGSAFCLSFLAALGFDDLSKGKIPGTKFVKIFAVAAVIPSAVFWPLKVPLLRLLNRLLIIDQDASMAALAASLGAGLFLLASYAAILIISWRSKAKAPLLPWLILGLAVLDPAYHNRFVNPTISKSFFDQPRLLAELGTPVVLDRTEIYAPFLKETMGNNIRLLNYFRQSLYPFTSMGEDVRYVFNVDFYGTYPRDYREKVQAIKALPLETQDKVLMSLGCNYYIGGDARYAREKARRVVVEGLPIFIEKIFGGTVPPFIARTVFRSGSREEMIKILAGDSFDPLKDAVLPKDGGSHQPALKAEGPPGGIIALEEAQGYGRYQIVLPRDGVAVFPGNYSPGWKALVDGREVAVQEANLFSKGIFLAAGEHELVLRYLPKSFVLGVKVSVMAVFLLAFGTVWAVVRAKRTGRLERP